MRTLIEEKEGNPGESVYDRFNGKRKRGIKSRGTGRCYKGGHVILLSVYQVSANYGGWVKPGPLSGP